MAICFHMFDYHVTRICQKCNDNAVIALCNKAFPQAV